MKERRHSVADSSLSGIDVSSSQGLVNWAAIPNQNLSFAFLRATLGAHTADQQFAHNWARIGSAGLLRGAYHFFWPLSAAPDQADNLIGVVGSLVPGDLPPALDLEEAYLKKDPQLDVWTTIAPENRLPRILAWLTRVEDALGARPIIYSRQNFLETLLGPSLQHLAAYPLWIAHYTEANEPDFPSNWPQWTFWQYTDKGSVEGIKGYVDQDRFNGSLDDLKALGKS